MAFFFMGWRFFDTPEEAAQQCVGSKGFDPLPEPIPTTIFGLKASEPGLDRWNDQPVEVYGEVKGTPFKVCHYQNGGGEGFLTLNGQLLRNL